MIDLLGTRGEVSGSRDAIVIWRENTRAIRLEGLLVYVGKERISLLTGTSSLDVFDGIYPSIILTEHPAFTLTPTGPR